MKAKGNYFIKVLGISIIAILMLSLSNKGVYGSSSTVLLFDDFNSDTLDTSVWQFQTNSSGSGYTIANGIISINSGTTNGGGGWLRGYDVFVPDDNILTFETRARVSDVNWLSFWGLIGGPSIVAGFGIIHSNTLAFDSTTGSGTSDIQITLAPFPALDLLDWHDYRVEVSNSAANYYIDDQLVATVNDPTYLLGGLPLHVRLDKGSDGIKRELQIDYVRISKRPLVRTVTIDIKPNSDPSSWPCKNANEGIPVAILSNAEFDATMVDADSVRFGKSGTEAGEAYKDENGHAKRHVEDVNKDGLPDMVFHFRFGDTGLSCDDIPAGEKSVTLTAGLTGSTFDGISIEGDGLLRLVQD